MSKGRKRYRNFYRKLREPAEWFLIWLGSIIIPPLSMRGVLRLSRFIADTAYLVDRQGKAISWANLETMFPGISERRKKILVHGAYRNMARVLVMIFWMSRNTKERIFKWVSADPRIRGLLEANRPCVTVSAHIGNWELLSQTCVANGFPMTSVAKQIGTDGMTERLTKVRSRIGQEIVPAEGALRGLMRALKKGNYIGLLVDQHTHNWNGGTWVDFFGIPAGVSMAPASLAKKFNVPILFAWSRPLRDGGYRIELGEFFQVGPDSDPQELTQRVVSAFEKVIRNHPSLWCLNYRRWRYIKHDAAHPERYPSYARPERHPLPQQ